MDGSGCQASHRQARRTNAGISAGSAAGELAAIGVGDEVIGVGEGKNGTLREVLGKRVKDVQQRFEGPPGT